MHSHPSGFLQTEWSPALGFIVLYRNLTLERKNRAYVPRSVSSLASVTTDILILDMGLCSTR